jgi:hypothetical protein
MLRTILLIGLVGLATPALSAGEELFRLGGDVFASGSSVTLDAPGTDDVFAAGERVEIASPITGSAHLAGRRIISGADVGADLFGFGSDVSVGAPVAGNATLAGYDVAVDAAVGGNLRAAGRTVRVAAPVAGSAMLAAGTLSLDAAIAGDTVIAADALEFGPDARIEGSLRLYGDKADALEVPASVVPADRIERHRGRPDNAVSDPFGMEMDIAGPSWVAVTVGFVIGILVLAVFAFLAALIAPRQVERLGEEVADAPFRTFWIGFLTLSALIGACVVAILTVIGVLAVPVIVLATIALCFLGYLVAVYLVGRAVWSRFDRVPPVTLSERAIAALAGAVIVTLLGLVPFVGWPLLLILTLTGLGALSVATFRPEFGR